MNIAFIPNTFYVHRSSGTCTYFKYLEPDFNSFHTGEIYYTTSSYYKNLYHITFVHNSGTHSRVVEVTHTEINWLKDKVPEKFI